MVRLVFDMGLSTFVLNLNASQWCSAESHGLGLHDSNRSASSLNKVHFPEAKFITHVDCHMLSGLPGF